jgi:hypothetical protein
LDPVAVEAGVMVLPLPLEATLTEAPATGLLLPSLTTTVMVLVPVPAVIVVGDAETSEFAALGAPSVAVALNVAVPTPDTTALTVLAPVDGPSVHCVLANPWASVVLFVGETVPPPVPTTQVTGRPGTGLFWLSNTPTTNGFGSSEEGGPVWPSPEIFCTALGRACTVCSSVSELGAKLEFPS